MPHDATRKENITVRLDEVEKGVLERIKDISGFKNRSDSLRQCIRLANVIFDPRLTVKKAFMPEMLKMLIENEEIRNETPLSHLLKPVHKIEESLYPDIKKEREKF